MKIVVYSIEKSIDENINLLVKEYIKKSSRYTVLEDKTLFNKDISKAQIKGNDEAKESYTKMFEPYLKNSFNVALDVCGEDIDSFKFAELLENESKINFFIGGAFGLEKAFLNKTQRVISLSRLTYAHKIAKIVLFEQIYRGLCINNNHPYHK